MCDRICKDPMHVGLYKCCTFGNFCLGFAFSFRCVGLSLKRDSE